MATKKQTSDTPGGRIEHIAIEREMQDSFLEYAMSVIVSRALPDVRDGLKPVHRRILFSMGDSGIRPGTPYRKSARVIGDVMGWFHPHSNDAIYDALVRLGQEFASREPLIDPQGNFGTVDDPPAAMRYTECRLTASAMKLLESIDEGTVDFVDNYSGERQEPVVLPARFPNLLVNGSTGIAVGMATNIPPHNLGEVVDAVLHTLENPDATAEDLMEFIKGPDFPTGAYIVGTAGIRDACLTGRGSIKMRAVTEVEEVGKNRTGIVVTEIPYQVSRDRIMEKIANAVREKKITGISDLRDESDRNGTRIVIELKRDAVARVVENQLYKLTQLQESFGVNMVALVDGVPRTLNIAEMVGYYIDHQMEVIERRTQHRLEKAEARAHIVDGLLIALDNIDEVVKVIRNSKDADTAKTALMKKFKLSEIQAGHILDMPLRRLTALETNKLREESAELAKTIKYLNGLLKSPKKRRDLIAEELSEIREKFANHRRSRVIPDEGDMSLEDLIADEELVIALTAGGYIKSVSASAYKRQGRGGRGVIAANMSEDDVVTTSIHTTAHAYLLFFSNLGKVYRVKAHEIPKKARTAKGSMIHSVLPLQPDERIEAVVDTRDYESYRFLAIATKSGQIKKTKFSEYDSRNAALIAIKLEKGDEVVAVRLTSGKNDVLMFTKNGLGIRFAETDIRPTGRDTMGVHGIKLRKGDEVVAAATSQEGDSILMITTKGYGKRTPIKEFPKQKRAGIGVKAIKVTPTRGPLVAARSVTKGTQIFVTSSDGVVIRTEADSISQQKRDATGVKVMTPAKGAEVTALALVPLDEEVMT
ncbi:MAG: DNA gyrase subunit A [Acidimicrobiia bacterium]|nr:DNA gyrase subunit A [Acidimicrobiia bacterium]